MQLTWTVKCSEALASPLPCGHSIKENVFACYLCRTEQGTDYSFTTENEHADRAHSSTQPRKQEDRPLSQTQLSDVALKHINHRHQLH